MPLTAIVLAAGEGTRMKSHHPKIVHKLLDKPIVWWSVNAAITAGADRVIVVVGDHADEVKSALSSLTLSMLSRPSVLVLVTQSRL